MPFGSVGVLTMASDDGVIPSGDTRTTRGARFPRSRKQMRGLGADVAIANVRTTLRFPLHFGLSSYDVGEGIGEERQGAGASSVFLMSVLLVGSEHRALRFDGLKMRVIPFVRCVALRGSWLPHRRDGRQMST